MFVPPFYPNYYNYKYYNQKKNYILDEKTKNSDNKENLDNKQNHTKDKKKTSKYNSFANINLSALFESNLDTPILEILGIKLYLDDLIIIGLLFFLYKEEVQDEILFGILLLLLLS